jgi:hypothetical protein
MCPCQAARHPLSKLTDPPRTIMQFFLPLNSVKTRPNLIIKTVFQYLVLARQFLEFSYGLGCSLLRGNGLKAWSWFWWISFFVHRVPGQDRVSCLACRRATVWLPRAQLSTVSTLKLSSVGKRKIDKRGSAGELAEQGCHSGSGCEWTRQNRRRSSILIAPSHVISTLGSYRLWLSISLCGRLTFENHLEFYPTLQCLRALLLQASRFDCSSARILLAFSVLRAHCATTCIMIRRLAELLWSLSDALGR